MSLEHLSPTVDRDRHPGYCVDDVNDAQTQRLTDSRET